jgi:hypothetical protein
MRIIHKADCAYDLLRLFDRFGPAQVFDLIASAPKRHTGKLFAGVHRLSFPITTPEVIASLLWHLRRDTSPAYRWLRK